MYIRRIAQAFAEKKNSFKFKKNLDIHDTWKLEFRAESHILMICSCLILYEIFPA